MASYLGFFSLIWFTWLQVGLFDVRFAIDSLFLRATKSVAICVMGLFAFSGPLFDTSDTQDDYRGFRIMCYALFIQRMVLALQYGVVLWSVRSYRGTIVPIASTMGVMIITGIIFLGIRWGFPVGKDLHAYVGL